MGFACVPALSFVVAIFLWPMKAFSEPGNFFPFFYESFICFFKEPEFSLDTEEFDMIDSSDGDVIEDYGAPPPPVQAQDKPFKQQFFSVIFWVISR